MKTSFFDSQGLDLVSCTSAPATPSAVIFSFRISGKFHQQYPKLPIKVTNATSLNCVDLLEQGKVDLIITNAPNTRLNQSYIRKTVCEFHDAFVANPAYYPLKSRVLRLAELSGYPLITLERHCTTCEFLHNLFLQHQLELVPETFQ